jgi:hypothetical protein
MSKDEEMMSMSSITAMGRAVVWAWIFLAVVILAAPGAALAAGPFAGLDGYWVGTGTVALRSGTKERMRCKAQYAVNPEGSNLQISLTCDSDTYKFHVNSYVNAAGGSLSGNWSETTRNVSGGLSGRASPGKLQVRLNAGGQFGASMAVTLKANQLAVSVNPSGTSVASVSAALNRAR